MTICIYNHNNYWKKKNFLLKKKNELHILIGQFKEQLHWSFSSLAHLSTFLPSLFFQQIFVHAVPDVVLNFWVYYLHWIFFLVRKRLHLHNQAIEKKSTIQTQNSEKGLLEVNKESFVENGVWRPWRGTSHTVPLRPQTEESLLCIPQ